MRDLTYLDKYRDWDFERRFCGGPGDAGSGVFDVTTENAGGGMMEIKLKPCPVCGGTNLKTRTTITINEKRHSVCCLDCEHRGPISLRSDVEAQAAWNGVFDILYQEERREERVSKMLAALDACVGRSCGHCPYTTPRTATCERMVKADAAALIRALWGEIEQKNREE